MRVSRMRMQPCFVNRREATLLNSLSAIWPSLLRLPIKELQESRQARETIRSMAVKFVRESRDQLAKDILSLMIAENRKTEVDGDRLSEDEMVNQVTVFLAAGHETTSLGVCP